MESKKHDSVVSWALQCTKGFPGHCTRCPIYTTCEAGLPAMALWAVEQGGSLLGEAALCTVGLLAASLESVPPDTTKNVPRHSQNCPLEDAMATPPVLSFQTQAGNKWLCSVHLAMAPEPGCTRAGCKPVFQGLPWTVASRSQGLTVLHTLPHTHVNCGSCCCQPHRASLQLLLLAPVASLFLFT